MARRDGVIEPHAHGCTKCRARYEDSCQAAEINSLCGMCRLGKRWELLYQNRLPKDCCRQASRIATKEDKKQYKLAGPKDHEWWRCSMCGRTHPFNPNEK